MQFVDECKIYIKSGDGGDGCLSFRREKNVARGGPDGGDGGRGGNVYAEATEALNTLIDYRYQQHIKAGKGRHGSGKNRTGAAGTDVVIRVPLGTEIRTEDGETLLADLTRPGQRVLLAEGGRGGLGNAHFKSSTNRAPRRTTPGGEGRETRVMLRLKLLADVGLVGLPNAGKSTFLAAVSNARPKIADYPFTTLTPQLGMVERAGMSFVIADIPGLIEGAHEGGGLGDRFLGHIERCRAVLHLVDGTAADVAAHYRTVRRELAEYGAGLTEKPEVVALSKVDAIEPADAAEKCAVLEAAAESAPFPVSAVSGSGVDAVLDRLAFLVAEGRAAESETAETQPYDPVEAGK